MKLVYQEFVMSLDVPNAVTSVAAGKAQRHREHHR